MARLFNEHMTLPWFKAASPPPPSPGRSCRSGPPALKTLPDHLRPLGEGDSATERCSTFLPTRDVGRLDDHDLDAATTARRGRGGERARVRQAGPAPMAAVVGTAGDTAPPASSRWSAW
jgi:hypothetical protein